MASAYEFIGPQEQEYPAWGLRVAPGDVVRLDGRPPADGNFRELADDAEPTAVAGTEPPAETVETTEGSEPGGDQSPADPPKQPNLAASAAEWTTYAKQAGVPAEVADNATRKAIIEHFTGGQPLEGVEPPAADDGEGQGDGQGDPQQPGADADSTQQHTETEGQ